MSSIESLEFSEFPGNTTIRERYLPEKGHIRTGRWPGSLERTFFSVNEREFGQQTRATEGTTVFTYEKYNIPYNQ